MDKAAAKLKTFFNAFAPAYQPGTVPDDAPPLHITYKASFPEWGQKGSLYAQVWDRSTTDESIIRIADQITAAVGERKKISYPGGYLVIWPESPQVQLEKDGDYRYAYLNFSINVYNRPGV